MFFLSPQEFAIATTSVKDVNNVLRIISDDPILLHQFLRFQSLQFAIERLEKHSELLRRESLMMYDGMMGRGLETRVEPFIKDRRARRYNPLRRNRKFEKRGDSIDSFYSDRGSREPTKSLPSSTSSSSGSSRYFTPQLGTRAYPIVIEDSDNEDEIREVQIAVPTCPHCALQGHVISRCPRQGEYIMSPDGTWKTPGGRIVRSAD
jgi:hypothetical protein